MTAAPSFNWRSRPSFGRWVTTSTPPVLVSWVSSTGSEHRRSGHTPPRLRYQVAPQHDVAVGSTRRTRRAHVSARTATVTRDAPSAPGHGSKHRAAPFPREADDRGRSQLLLPPDRNVVARRVRDDLRADSRSLARYRTRP